MSRLFAPDLLRMGDIIMGLQAVHSLQSCRSGD